MRSRPQWNVTIVLGLLPLFFGVAGCRSFPDGRYMGTVGAVPIDFELRTVEGQREAEFFNGAERFTSTSVQKSWKTLRIRFDQYDSELAYRWNNGFPFSPNAAGVWEVRRSGGELSDVRTSLNSVPGGFPYPYDAENRDSRVRRGEGFIPAPELAGRWRVEFEKSGPAVGVFEVSETGMATGTFLTPTGDFRYLTGDSYRLGKANRLFLSTFDGAHLFSFTARQIEDGSLKGRFRSGDWWQEEWTAVRDDDAALPDAMGQTTWRSDTELDELVFADLDGNPTSVAQAMDALDDEGARATVLLVFGSWCPNCADATEYLVELQQKYHARGLRVLGLAFELTGDLERDAKQVRIHQEHHAADWPVLIAGLSDKAKASQALPVLDKVRSYPTTIFMGPDREPVGIWTGFSGPATGQAHRDLRDRWEAMIEDLLGG